MTKVVGYRGRSLISVNGRKLGTNQDLITLIFACGGYPPPIEANHKEVQARFTQGRFEFELLDK